MGRDVRVGLLWGRCVSYVCENCILYARQTRAYHMSPKVHFCLLMPFVFGVLFIRIRDHVHVFMHINTVVICDYLNMPNMNYCWLR